MAPPFPRGGLMQDIQAFVGHSFRPEDRALIQVFIDHFRTLAHSYPGFSWDHAEKAEAVPLAQKVLEKIDGKNVFIGICTRTEQAVAPNALQQLWLSNRLHAKRSDFVWKTSDWLIQEIGLAVGRLPKIQRNATTWNNLGVSFEHFKMPVKSIEAYRISEKEKETLAMANLGFKLLSAGFLSEAKALCEQALEIPDRHKNIGALWNRLNEVPDEEDEELRKLQEKLGDKASFYRRLGEAASAQTLSVTTGKWETPDGPLEATTTAAGVRIFGTVQLPENSLIAGLVGTLGGTQRTYMQTVEYQLRFRGQMAFGTVKRVKEDARPTVFDAVSAGNKVLLYFEGADILRVMEQPNSVSPSFYAIKRLRE